VKLRAITACVTVAMFLFAIAACGSDSKSSSTTTTTPKDAVCADKAKLENSVDSLIDGDLVTSGTSGIESAVKKIQKNLDALRTSVKADLQPKVDDVKSALTDLNDAVGDVDDGSLTDNIEAIGKAVAKVGSTTGVLFSELNAQCPD
jgi:hypothetical protein